MLAALRTAVSPAVARCAVRASASRVSAPSVPAAALMRSFSSSPRALAVRFTKEHEWVDLSDDGVATVGITKHAADQLGDVVYVEVQKGQTVSQGDEFGSIESVKAVSQLYAPLSGQIESVNDELESGAEVVNEDPYGDGWIAKFKATKPAEFEQLLSKEAYEKFVKESE
ncbi:hypothetical protein OC846_005245 [Tilletia horrida]|uniref:Glycine cleavage system H protein n=1 Tax=Tilletia horrida TaxID=155126 RepID=A0AAN6GL93_9BASI|nr:hypothetical protein OC845_005459 [Tilletia horrida]KAK0546478.1 hypothetical protein OC846_005245 [Tilletia horrida]KAK0562255.1 hypothetical protein OC861_005415 [Tilletia horrida]